MDLGQYEVPAPVAEDRDWEGVDGVVISLNAVGAGNPVGLLDQFNGAEFDGNPPGKLSDRLTWGWVTNTVHYEKECTELDSRWAVHRRII